MHQKTFRLFISSTFSDFKNEREILQTEVFPFLEIYCAKKGYQFQPIDLRWGVNEEAQLDQKTLEVCLNEVKACKHYPHPNFLIMLGDRYGWIPLPYLIEKNEFESIVNATSSIEDKELLNFWYKLDKNHLPASYILQERKEIYSIYDNWEKEENKLRDIFQSTVTTLNISQKEKEKYFLSATEQEVIYGICDYKEKIPFQQDCNGKIDKEYIYAFLRKVPDENNLDENIKNFRENIKETFLKENIITNIDADYIEQFAKEIQEKLIQSIDAEIQRINALKQKDPLQIEKDEQERFKQEKLKVFVGREDILKDIDNYIQDTNTTQPLVIYGRSGMGKSALMAKAIEEAQKRYEDKKIVYRFVGSTQESTNIRNLLISICDELEKYSLIEKVEVYEEDTNKFNEQISKILGSIADDVIIFIDALDQLQTKSYMNWLPEKLSASLKMIFSVLNDSDYKEDSHYYDILSIKMDKENFIDIEESESLDARKIIELYLMLENRKLTDSQYAYAIDRFHQASDSPLYLKIAIEEMKHWRSWEKAGEKYLLANGTREIVEEYMDNLSKIYHHEKIVVDKVFGYLHYAKDGLSQKELTDILSHDLDKESLFQSAILNEFHTPVKKYNNRTKKIELVLPASVLARLYFQIEPFMTIRNVDNQPLIKFFHRQFTSVVEQRYNANRELYHTRLADYFLLLQDKTKTWDKRYYSIRSLSELAHQLYHAKRYNTLFEILTDLEFWGAIYDNHKHIRNREVLEQTIQNHKDFLDVDTLQVYESFFRENEHLIVKVDDELWRPKQTLFQLAYEDGDNSPLSQYVDELIENEKVDFHWLRNVNRPEKYTRSGLIKVLEGHTIFVKGALELKNGKILSWSDDNTLRIWSSHGREIAVLAKHTDSVNGAIELRDGRILSWSNDKTLRIWSSHGREIAVLAKHTDSVNGAIELRDGRILSWSNDKTLRIWSSDGEKLVVFDVLPNGVNSVLELNNKKILLAPHVEPVFVLHNNTIYSLIKNKYFVTGGLILLTNGNILSYGGYILQIWNSNGDKLYVLEGHTNFVTGAIELQDGRILSWSEDKTLRIWSKDGKELAVLEGHTKSVKNAIEFQDGTILSWSEKFDSFENILWNYDIDKKTNKDIILHKIRKICAKVSYKKIKKNFIFYFLKGMFCHFLTPKIQYLIYAKSNLGLPDQFSDCLELKDGKILTLMNDILKIWHRTSLKQVNISKNQHNENMHGILELEDNCRIISWGFYEIVIWYKDKDNIWQNKYIKLNSIIHTIEVKDNNKFVVYLEDKIMIFNNFGKQLSESENNVYKGLQWNCEYKRILHINDDIWFIPRENFNGISIQRKKIIILDQQPIIYEMITNQKA